MHKTNVPHTVFLAVLSMTIAAVSCSRTPAVDMSGLPPALETPGSERLTFKSGLLAKEMALYVHLPPGYDRAKKYPVVYLLHGFGNSEVEWFDYYHMDVVADRLVSEGRMKPAILVAPQMDNGWGTDSGEPKRLSANPKTSIYSGPYESYLVKEVVPLVDARYPTLKDASSRCIAGVSMGGYSALHIGLRNRKTFGAIAAHSPAIRSQFIPDWLLYSKDRPAEKNDPVYLAARERQGKTRLWLDCGDGDGLLSGVAMMRDALEANGWKIEYSTAPGVHDANYWVSRLEDYLVFYSGQ